MARAIRAHRTPSAPATPEAKRFPTPLLALLAAGLLLTSLATGPLAATADRAADEPLALRAHSAAAPAAETRASTVPPAAHEVAIVAPEALGPAVPWPDRSTPATPPPDPQVGDAWLWWLHIHYPMPPHFEQHMCTVRGRSARAYVVVEDTQWNVTIDQADVDLILERWEESSIGPMPDEGIYAIDSLAFGAPPDQLDDDPRVYLLWFDFGIQADGFFFWFDEYPDGAIPGYRSNECEVLYLNSDAAGPPPSSDYMLSVIAHEFEHLIHWTYDDDELPWVDEGLAELAMWLYGRPDVISEFNVRPDNSLVTWGNDWEDYIKTYLWSLYIYERYGGLATAYAVVHEPANSIAGYQAVLDDQGYAVTVADVFADWAVANFLDDPTLADGRFGYLGDELPAFFPAETYDTYPVLVVDSTVAHWATDYYRFEALGGYDGLQLDFDGADGSAFAAWALLLPAVGSPVVTRMPLEPATQSGTLEVGGLGAPEDAVILVVAKVSSSGATDYIFSAAAQAAGIADARPPGNLSELRLECWPNPSCGAVALRLAGANGLGETAAALARIDVVDAAGRRVGLLMPAGEGAAGSPTFVWDGRGRTGRPVPPGVYYARGRLGSRTIGAPMLRLP